MTTTTLAANAIHAASHCRRSLWLHEHNGRRMNHAVAVNAFNALMWGAIGASIAWLRWVRPTSGFPTLF